MGEEGTVVQSVRAYERAMHRPEFPYSRGANPHFRTTDFRDNVRLCFSIKPQVQPIEAHVT